MLCEAALQTKRKHDGSVHGGLVKIAEHNAPLVTVILPWSKKKKKKKQTKIPERSCGYHSVNHRISGVMFRTHTE